MTTATRSGQLMHEYGSPAWEAAMLAHGRRLRENPRANWTPGARVLAAAAAERWDESREAWYQDAPRASRPVSDRTPSVSATTPRQAGGSAAQRVAKFQAAATGTPLPPAPRPSYPVTEKPGSSVSTEKRSEAWKGITWAMKTLGISGAKTPIVRWFYPSAREPDLRGLCYWGLGEIWLCDNHDDPVSSVGAVAAHEVWHMGHPGASGTFAERMADALGSKYLAAR